jgi:hypothetical protein
MFIYGHESCVKHSVCVAGVLVLNKIEEELNEMYMGSEPKARDLSWSPGQICIAKYHTDKNWYRAKVIKVLFRLCFYFQI